MDYYNIYSESDLFTVTSNNSIQTLHNLNNYYKSVHDFGEVFMNNTKKAIEAFFEEQIKLDTKSSLSKNLIEFYRNYEDYTIKSKNVLNKLYKDIIEPVDLFKNNLSCIFEECQSEMKLIATNVCEAKRNLEKIRLKYYEGCRAVNEQEKQACKSITGKLISNSNHFEKTHDTLLKFKSQKENFAMIYKYELNKANKVLEENEKLYFGLLNKIKSNEESKIFFIKIHMEKFSKIFNDLSSILQEFYNRINTSLVSVNIEEDIKLFYEKFKNLSINNEETGGRFQKEEFVGYDSYLKQQELLSQSSSNKDYENSSENYSPKRKSSDGDNFNYLNTSYSNFPAKKSTDSSQRDNLDKKAFLEDFEMVENSELYSDKYLNNLCEGFIIQIFSDEEVELDLIGKVMDALEKNPAYCKTVIDAILSEKKNLYLQYHNYFNMQHLANIFYNISTSIDTPNHKFNDLNFAIIFIGERSYYLDEKTQNKSYLCSLLSKNKLYSRKSFWLDLIKLKLSRRVEEHIKKISKLKTEKQINTINKNMLNPISEELKSASNNNNNGYNKQNYNSENNFNNKNLEEMNKSDDPLNGAKAKLPPPQENEEKDSGLFGNMTSKLMNFFSGNNNNSNNKSESNSNKKNLRGLNDSSSARDLLNNNSSVAMETRPDVLDIQKIFANYPKIITSFNSLDNKKKSLLEKAISREIANIVKEFIPHFANFNYDISEAIDLLVELSTKFKLEKEKLNYFITYLNSNFYTIKNKIGSISANGEFDFEGKTLKKNKIREIKFDSIMLSLNYLDNKSKLNMLEINKSFSNKNQKKIYYKILKNLEKENKLTNQMRLNLWRKILNVKEIKKAYDYKALLEEIEVILQVDPDENLANYIKIIDLDVERTFFEKDIEKSRKAIANILKGIAYFVPKISYCQGMNYIAAFLYQISSSEEEAFDLMYALFLNTDFSQIFVDELAKLNKYFYVFERLIFLYLPELYLSFKTNSITVNYFCSSWFITLFTNSLHYNLDYECPKIIMNIWDDFLLNGWIAILRGGITLLKNYEHFLIDQKYEDLLQYLINDLIKSDFFLNSNYENYLKIKQNIKIKSSLINNIESEIIQENKADFIRRESSSNIETI